MILLRPKSVILISLLTGVLPDNNVPIKVKRNNIIHDFTETKICDLDLSTHGCITR